MAEFLIKNQKSGGELPGDIVEVRPDGAVYGRLELDSGRFLIIKVAGLSYKDSLFLMDALIDPIYYNPERPEAIRILKRRQYTIEDAFPFLSPYLVSGNVYEIPVHASWNSFLKNKGT